MFTVNGTPMQSNISWSGLPLVYSETYNLSFGGVKDFCDFDNLRAARIRALLLENNVVQPQDFVSPPELSRKVLMKHHHPVYLRNLESPKGLARLFNVPRFASLTPAFISSRILNPLQHATGGSLLATRLALQKGFAINLSGGFSAASSDAGCQLSLYADISLILRMLKEETSDIRKIMIIDIDSEQGEQWCGALRDFDKGHFDGMSLCLLDAASLDQQSSNEQSTLENFVQVLHQRISSFKPDLIIFVAGTECMLSCSAASLPSPPKLSFRSIIKRDEYVFAEALENHIPIVMLLGGGFHRYSAKCTAESISNLLQTFNLRALASTQNIIVPQVPCEEQKEV